MPPVTVSEVYDAVLTTTLRRMSATLEDNITRGNKLITYLRKSGNEKKQRGGERIQVALMYGLNSGADVYQGYGIIQTTPQDGITSAFYEWAQMAVPITISGLEEEQNSGDAAKLNLLKSKTTQSEAAGMQILNRSICTGRLQSGASGNRNRFVPIIGNLDSAASGPLPLAAFVDADPTRSVTFGSINAGTETWWRNQSRAFSGSTFAAYKQAKNRVYNDCSKGIMGNPNLILSDQLVWELYFNSLQSQERYYVTDQRTIDMLGGAGEEMLKFRGAVHIWDEVVPDVGTTTATPETEAGKGDGVGTYLQSGAHGTEYYLNTKTFEYVCNPNRNWTATPFIKPANQDVRTSHLLWMGQLVCNNRRKNGVLYDIDNSIVS